LAIADPPLSCIGDKSVFQDFAFQIQNVAKMHVFDRFFPSEISIIDPVMLWEL
jgi:hypothetical protein